MCVEERALTLSEGATSVNFGYLRSGLYACMIADRESTSPLATVTFVVIH
jgi:hypothetical protein